MLQLTVRIGEHRIRFQTASSPVMAYLDEKFGGLRTEGKEESSPDDLVIAIEEGYGVPFVDFNVAAAANGDGVAFTRADYRIEADRQIRSARLYVYNWFALKHALINLYSAFVVARDWGLLIHSSCLLDRNNAYLFAGHSGAGKSTVVQLSSPRPILSDEATIVKIGTDGITVFESPFRSDTVMPGIPGEYPLSGVHMLRQALYDRRSRMAVMPGLVELMNRVFYWSYDPAETGKVFKLCKRMVDQVPVYDLYFRKSNTFWEEIS